MLACVLLNSIVYAAYACQLVDLFFYPEHISKSGRGYRFMQEDGAHEVIVVVLVKCDLSHDLFHQVLDYHLCLIQESK